MNYDKTKIYRLGSLRKSDAKLITQNTVTWTNDPINILGIWVTDDVNEAMNLNFDPLVEKTKIILNSWKSRNLTLIGKILVLNTLIASLFV